jgi:hypothetical protein
LAGLGRCFGEVLHFEAIIVLAPFAATEDDFGDFLHGQVRVTGINEDALHLAGEVLFQGLEGEEVVPVDEEVVEEVCAA